MNTQFERMCAKIYEDAFSTDVARCAARASLETGRVFNAVANEKPFAHAFSVDRDVCEKCGITAQQAVELGVAVCNVE